MKKKLLMIVIALLLIVPIKVCAEVKEMSLEEALEMENINAKYNNVTKNNPIEIVAFIGDGCPHCREFLEYSSSTLMTKYGDKITFKIYEVWNNTDNQNLMNKVCNYYKVSCTGVPFIAIGNTKFLGYAESMNSNIEKAIMGEYNSKDRINIIEESLNNKAEYIAFLRDFEPMTLEEALDDEGISYDYNRVDTTNKINVYAFTGKGCPHCYEFLKYAANDLMKQYNDKINIIVLETWNSEKNKTLAENVLKQAKKEELNGVPLFLIGNKDIRGYSSDYNKQITDAIDLEYEKKTEDRIDLVKNYVLGEEEHKQKERTNSYLIYQIIFTVASICIFAVILGITLFALRKN